MRRGLLLLCSFLIGGCESSKSSGPVDGGKLRACYTEAACAGLRSGDKCYFAQPHDKDPTGFCAPAEPPCTQSHPYCGVDNETFHACRFPAKPWRHAGPCEDVLDR